LRGKARVLPPYEWPASFNINPHRYNKSLVSLRIHSLTYSTILAKYYYYSATNSYGTNTKLYQSAVGDHPERVNNLYFTFIFLLRAVIKAKDHLLEYPYYTGNSTDDALVAAYFTKLYDNSITLNNIITINDINECKNGFDESILFQEHVPVDALGSDEQLCEGGRKNKILLEEFRNRFRNITKIMDCVSCDKCRIWGKVQILGIGTAIKILLTPNEDFRKINGLQLHRQEVIALVNTIHQFSTSVDFAYSAGKQLPGGSPSSQNLVIAIVTSLCIIIVTFVKICKSRLR
jgi:ERO1-like protein alpha